MNELLPEAEQLTTLKTQFANIKTIKCTSYDNLRVSTSGQKLKLTEERVVDKLL